MAFGIAGSGVLSFGIDADGQDVDQRQCIAKMAEDGCCSYGQQSYDEIEGNGQWRGHDDALCLHEKRDIGNEYRMYEISKVGVAPQG